MARDAKGHFLPGNKEGKKIGATGGLPTEVMTILGHAGKAAKKKLEAVMEKIAQQMTFAPVLDAETKRELEEGFGVQGDDALRFHKMVKGLIAKADQGDPRAIELLLKIAGLYVERTENVNENRTEFTNIAEWKQYVKGINE